MLAILRTIPIWAYILAFALVAIGVQQMRILSAHNAFADYRLEIAERDKRADAAARTEEQRRQSIADKEAKKAYEQQSIAEIAAATARADADSLRKQVDRLLASRKATANAIAAAGSKAAQSATRVLAELLNESVKRNQILAEEATRSRIEGQTCERFADGIKN